MNQTRKMPKHLCAFFILLCAISGICILVYKSQFRFDLHQPIQYIMMTTHKDTQEVILSQDSPQLSESFLCTVPELKKFSMECSVQNVNSKAKLSITLSNANTGEIYYHSRKKVKTFQSEDSHTIKCGLDENFFPDEGALLTLTLELENAQDTTLNFTANKKQTLVKSFNFDENERTNIIYSLSYGDNNFMFYLYIILCVMLLFLTGLSFYLIIVRHKKVQQFFIPIALSLGIIFQGLITVHGVPDEPTHLDTAYKYSNQILLVGNPDVPGTIYKRECDAKLSDMLSNGLESNSYYQLLYHTFERASDTNLITVTYSDASHLVPAIVYFPAALGISVGRILGLSAMFTYQLGRVFNLIAFILLVQCAICITPYWKNLFAALGILPITLQQAASASYDAIINGIIFLFIAMCFLLSGSTQHKKSQLILTGLFALFVASVKGGVYLPLLLLLLLFIPHNHREKSWKKLIIKLLPVAVIGIFFIVIALIKFMPLLSNMFTADANPDPETSLYSISYVLHNPLQTVYLLWNTLIKVGDDLIRGMFGGMLSWLDVKMNWFFIIIFLISTLLLINTKNDSHYFSRKKRMLITMSCLCSSLLIILSMLVGYTKMKYNYIQGLQGRYFIPFAPAMFSLATTKMVSVDAKQCSRIWEIIMITEILLILEMTTMIL